MTFLALALLAIVTMTSVCWASNLWPGKTSVLRGALSRLIWWAAPIAFVVRLNGAPMDHALTLGVAAWVGAWVPHVPMPRTDDHWTTVVSDGAIVMLRVLAVLAAPAAVFWLCGAFWQAMVWAAVCASPCMQLAIRLPGVGPGLCTPGQRSGVLFGACVGFWLAVAVWTPDASPDLLP